MELDESIRALRKKFGPNIIRQGNEVADVRRIPIPELPMFDYVSGGGLIHNRINEFLGENHSLKSWVLYHYIGIYQHTEWSTFTHGIIGKIEYNKNGSIKSFTLRRGKKIANAVALRAALIDYEHTYTPSWGEKMGIDTKGLILSQPGELSTGVDVAETLLADPEIGLVCIDSMSALGTDEEVNNPMENQQMGVAARFWNKATRKMLTAMNKNTNDNITLIVVNSEYEGMGQYETAKIKNGGQIKRAKSLSVKFRALKPIEAKVNGVDTIIGRNIVLKCLKDKGGIGFGRTGNFFYSTIDYELAAANSTDFINQIIELAVREGIVERLGTTYYFDKVKAVGMANFVKKISGNEIFDEIRKRVYSEVINPVI